jgi:hypothetical protein
MVRVVNPRLHGKYLPGDEWLRVGNQKIQTNSTMSKENFWEVREGIGPLWNPPSAPGSAQGFVDELQYSYWLPLL